MDALAIVAHPDDETIWMGAQFLRHPNWRWTVYALCRGSDRDREPKFRKACAGYGARPIITDLEDEHLRPLMPKEVMQLILDSLLQKEYDVIYTHGGNGEYGHIRHKEVHHAVQQLITEGRLKSRRLLCFNYQNEHNGCAAIKDKSFVELTPGEIMQKKLVITDIYGFRPGQFEERCCGHEGFVETRP